MLVFILVICVFVRRLLEKSLDVELKRSSVAGCYGVRCCDETFALPLTLGRWDVDGAGLAIV